MIGRMLLSPTLVRAFIFLESFLFSRVLFCIRLVNNVHCMEEPHYTWLPEGPALSTTVLLGRRYQCSAAGVEWITVKLLPLVPLEFPHIFCLKNRVCARGITGQYVLQGASGPYFSERERGLFPCE